MGVIHVLKAWLGMSVFIDFFTFCQIVLCIYLLSTGYPHLIYYCFDCKIKNNSLFFPTVNIFKNLPWLGLYK